MLYFVGFPHPNLPVAEPRTCILCGQEKPLAEFDKVGAHYRRRCRKCQALEPRQQTAQFLTPEGYLIYLHDHLKRRRADDPKKYEWEITHQTILDLYYLQGGKCALTGLHLTYERDRYGGQFNASIDRINSKLGYLPDNVRLVCKAVNIFRGKLTDTELLWWCKTLVSFMETGE